MKKPNILLIVLDTLSAKHMSLYGYHRRTTPFLEQFARECVVYKYCFAPAPWTSPSHASIFTGLYPPQHICEGFNLFLDRNLFSLPEILRDFGYKTYGCSCNNLICKFFQFDRGFLNFYDIFYRPLLREYLNQGLNKIERVKLLLKWMTFDFKDGLKYLFSCFHLTEYMSNYNVYDFSFLGSLDTIRYLNYVLKSHSYSDTDNFFIFLNIMETHAAFNPPKQYRNIFVKDHNSFDKELDQNNYPLNYYLCGYSDELLHYLTGMYDQEVLCTDALLCKIVAILKTYGFYDNTLLIITADHGESLGEHNIVEHSYCLYNENLHVPLIVKYPSYFGLKGLDEKLRQNLDIFHTICEILDAPIPYDSSLSLLNNSRKIALSYLITEPIMKIVCLLQRDYTFKPKTFMQPHISLITKDFWKIIKRRDGYIEIYDLNKDLYETNNLTNDPNFENKKKELENLIDKYSKKTGYDNAVIKQEEDIFRYFD